MPTSRWHVRVNIPLERDEVVVEARKIQERFWNCSGFDPILRRFYQCDRYTYHTCLQPYGVFFNYWGDQEVVVPPRAYCHMVATLIELGYESKTKRRGAMAGARGPSSCMDAAHLARYYGCPLSVAREACGALSLSWCGGCRGDPVCLGATVLPHGGRRSRLRLLLCACTLSWSGEELLFLQLAARLVSFTRVRGLRHEAGVVLPGDTTTFDPSCLYGLQLQPAVPHYVHSVAA